MGSLVYAAAIFVIILLGHWVYQNDKRVQKGEKARGIFAMKENDINKKEDD